jgi:outer membrane lipoprotein carrier protein
VAVLAATGLLPPGSLAAVSPAPAAAPATGGENALLGRILERARRVESFSSRFEQRLEPKGLPAPPVESGRVFYLRPDRMRWEYESPERKLAISDGKTGWLELPDEKRVVTIDLPADLRSGPLESLLSGRMDAAADFELVERPASRAADGAGPLLRRLRLTPRRRTESFDWMEIGVAPDTFLVREVVLEDPGGNRMTYTFSGLKEGAGGDPARFRYVPPAGYEVSSP